MENKKVSKSDISTNDAIYIIFTIIMGFCFIATAVVTLFVFICCCIFLVKSFTLSGASTIFKALALDILMLLCCALFVYIEILIYKCVVNNLKKYLIERKELLKELENNTSQE